MMCTLHSLVLCISTVCKLVLHRTSYFQLVIKEQMERRSGDEVELFLVHLGGGALYGLMGGGEEWHSSHSSGTPLQPAHTSHLLGVYKKERELRKRQSEHLPAHCQPCCLTDRGLFFVTPDL